MVWLLMNVFGMSEGSAIIRAPHYTIILVGCIAIAVLFYIGLEIDFSYVEKHCKSHMRPRHTIQK